MAMDVYVLAYSCSGNGYYPEDPFQMICFHTSASLELAKAKANEVHLEWHRARKPHESRIETMAAWEQAKPTKLLKWKSASPSGYSYQASVKLYWGRDPFTAHEVQMYFNIERCALEN